MARRAAARTEKEQELEILTALRFVSIAQREEGTPYQTHCRFTGTEVVAFDGILAAGHPSNQIMNACPHTISTIAALSRLRGQWSLTMLDANKLVLNDGKFRAVIPCLSPIDIDATLNNPLQWPLTDSFRSAAERAGAFITEGATLVVESSLLSRDGSLIGCNGKVLIEAWHGSRFPPGLIIPWALFRALKKIEKPIVGFGFDANSLTIYFEGGAWLKSQLFMTDYPDVSRLLTMLETAAPVPKLDELERAINAVLPHSDNSNVWIENNVVKSHADNSVGATYQLEGLPFAKSINGDTFLKIAPYILKIDFTTGENIYFFGDNLRGMMAAYDK